MDDPGSVTRLEDDLHSPDPRVRDEAARRIWERYAARLAALVRRNLDHRILRREDEGDILQSMYASFCRGRQQAEDRLANRDELWRLLIHMTLCKISNSARRHRAARRDVRREAAGPAFESGDSSPIWMLERMARSEPDPVEAMALQDDLERLLNHLTEDLRRIALWKLECYTNKEIGGMIGRTERMVELKMRVIRAKLESFLPDSSAPDPS